MNLCPSRAVPAAWRLCVRRAEFGKAEKTCLIFARCGALGGGGRGPNRHGRAGRLPARFGEEEHAIELLVGVCTVFDVDREIARRAGALRRKYLGSHSVELPDALIAATSELRSARLVTLNRRHYPMLADVLVPYRKRE